MLLLTVGRLVAGSCDPGGAAARSGIWATRFQNLSTFMQFDRRLIYD